MVPRSGVIAAMDSCGRVPNVDDATLQESRHGHSPVKGFTEEEVCKSPSRAKSRREKVRISLDVSSDVSNRLEALADEIDGTKSEVLRRAIVLMEVVVEARKSGKRVGIADSSGKLTTEFIGVKPMNGPPKRWLQKVSRNDRS